VVGAFAARYEESLRSDGDRPIAEDLAVALKCSNGEGRARLFEEIQRIDEPYTLALLYMRVTDDLRPMLANRVSQLTPAEVTRPLSYTEVRLRTEALLNAGLAEAAQAYISAERDIKTSGQVRQREEIRFVNDLRLAVLRKAWSDIYNAHVPEDVDSAHLQQANDSLAFFQGVANLLDPAGRPGWAEQMFLHLSFRFPHVPAYAHNLLVARVRQLFGDDVFAILAEESRDAANTALSDAARALTSLSASVAESDALDAYRGVILLGLKKTADAIELLGPRVVFSDNPMVAAVFAVGQHRLGDDAVATQALVSARERLGDSDVLRAAEAVLGNKPHLPVRAGPEQADDRDRAIREALGEFNSRDPEEQARILDKELHLLTGEFVRDASVLLIDLVPSLRKGRIEADYNATLHKLLRARAASFGWEVTEESPEGVTAKGKRARCDLAIKFEVSTYAVIEGVVVKKPVTQQWTDKVLRQHIAKVFKYSACSVFFHVTYSEINDARPIMPLLQDSAKTQAPPELAFLDARDLPERGSSPPGFIAEYADGSRSIYLVCIVLDIARRRQIGAAKLDERLNPRNTSAKKKGPAKTSSTKKTSPARKRAV
jgi:hypothetical protein